LLEALAEELPTDSIRFSSKLAAIESQEQGGGASIAVVHLEDGTIIKSKVLIGCDGLHSIVARWLGLAEPVHSGRSGVRGLAIFPQGYGFKQEVHQFVDEGKRAGFVPLNDREFYWFLTCKGQQTALLNLFSFSF
jgi:2-polyprenyl-6-methoxyphenol hydroxylase-like FAD-dependent oxidoreductase